MRHAGKSVTMRFSRIMGHRRKTTWRTGKPWLCAVDVRYGDNVMNTRPPTRKSDTAYGQDITRNKYGNKHERKPQHEHTNHIDGTIG